MRARRLPDGAEAISDQEYVDAWHNLANKIEGLFPGYKLYGYDPGMTFCSQETNAPLFEIDVHMANLLINTIEKNYTRK